MDISDIWLHQMAELIPTPIGAFQGGMIGGHSRQKTLRSTMIMKLDEVSIYMDVQGDNCNMSWTW